jgi:hypothetical protein
MHEHDAICSLVFLRAVLYDNNNRETRNRHFLTQHETPNSLARVESGTAPI